MTHQLARALLLLATACIVRTALAEPLRVSNGSPVARIVAPPAAEPSRLRLAGASEWSLASDWSSIATVTTRDNEEIVIDGETLALTGRWRHGRARWQWGLDVSYLIQGGGVLDNFINEYHDLFGFPEGDRPRLPDDQLIYLYRRDDTTLLDVNGSSDGFGDVRLSLAWQVYESADRAVALRGQLKLPSGDSDDLLGSGGTDLSLGVDGAMDIRVSRWTPQLYAGLGLLLSDEGDVLSELRETSVFYGHAGIAWPVWQTLTLNLQFDGHSALYDSDLPELGNALQLSVGGVWRFAPRWELGIGVLEDISTHSSPDVVFHFDLRRRSGR